MANKKIQGLTLEIGGNTTSLSKALKEPEKQTNDLQSKLRAVNEALKLDPSNTELLEQKQRLLSASIQNTTERLNLLKEAQKQFISSGKDIDSSEYIELQRQVAKTEQALKKLEAQQKEISSGFKKAEKSLDSFGKTAKGASDRLSKVSTAATGLLTAAAATVPATAELRSDLSKLDNNAREAGVGIEETRKAFENLAIASDETDSAVEATSNLLQAGFTESNLQKAVEGLTGAYLRFPDTLKIESLADSLQETLATGKATGQFAELLDRLGVNAESFSDQLANCSTEAERQNLALNVLSENGLQETYKGWKKNNEELISYKESMMRMQIELAKLGETLTPLITMLTQALNDFLSWFNQLDPSIQKLLGYATAFLAIAAPLLNWVGNIAIGISKLMPFLDKLSPLIKGIGKTFTSTFNLIKTVGVASFNGIKAATLGLIDVFSVPLVGAFNMIKNLASITFNGLKSAAVGAFGMLKTAAVSAFNVILTHPVAATIAAIVAALVALYAKCEWFRDAVNTLVKAIVVSVKMVINETVEFITKTIPETISKIVNWFSELPAKIGNALSNVLSSIYSWASDLVSAGASAARRLVDSIVSVVSSLPRKMLNIGKDLVRGIWDGISGMGDWLWKKVKGFCGGIVDWVADIFGIHSPSKVMRDEIGKYLVEGIGVGVSKNEKLALDPVKNIMNKMKDIDLNSTVNSSISQSLNRNEYIVIDATFVAELEGKPLFKKLERFVTNKQSTRLAFKGV